MPEENKPAPAGEVLLALQNRINDLEAKLQAAETEHKGKSFVDTAALDSKVAELRAEIAELRKVKKEVKAEAKEAPAKETPNAQAPERSALREAISLLALDE